MSAEQTPQEETSEPEVEEDKCDKKGKKSSPAWEFFDELKGCPVGFEKAKCKFCSVEIACNASRNGTSAMMNHLKMVCPKSPLRKNLDKLQKTLQFQTLSKDDKSHTLKAHTFNLERLRKKFALMCIKDNQPFRIVEHEGFRELLNEAEPRFTMPSRWTVARDCLKIYDWKICKKILNFRQIGSHKGDVIGKMLVELFGRWGIDLIFTITLDNASSNDTAISHLKKFLRGPKAILENKFLHMRCCAHILNLVVKDGLKEQHESIARIRNAVRYVRSSPSRLEKFRKCVEREKIKCDRMVCLDVDTRWNSTYTMLDVAVKYKGAFIRMITEDSNYEAYFKVDILEVSSDNAKKKRKLLKYCTSNVFFVELVKVQEAIVRLCSSDDMVMRDMANRMRDKYNKYWDNMENTNFLLYVAVVLDPTYKMSYIEFCFAKIYGRGSSKSFLMCDKVLKTLQELFDHYKNLKGVTDSSSSSKTNPLNDTWDDDYEKYMENWNSGGMGKSELDIYLVDERERKSECFDILIWWKTDSTRLPILSDLAKHVLGMSVSYVASEAAFITSGRTIDTYRSSLSPKTTEALVCSQDWLNSSGNTIDLIGEPEEYMQFEKMEDDDVHFLFCTAELKVFENLMDKLDIDN